MRHFFLGLGVGLAGGILLAPKSGTETREYLGKKSDEGLDYVKTRATELGGAAQNLVSQGKTAATDLVDKTKTAANDLLDKGKQAIRNEPHVNAMRDQPTV